MERCPRAWTLRQRIEHFLTPPDANGCRCWTRSTTYNGYGRINYQHRKYVVHRAVLEDILGRPLGAGMMALHTCDNRLCCEPTHLYEGTAKNNSDDMFARGRDNVMRGSKNGLAKLTERDVRKIRAAAGDLQTIADRFGTSKQNVWRIRHRKSWAHI